MSSLRRPTVGNSTGAWRGHSGPPCQSASKPRPLREVSSAPCALIVAESAADLMTCRSFMLRPPRSPVPHSRSNARVERCARRGGRAMALPGPGFCRELPPRIARRDAKDCDRRHRRRQSGPYDGRGHRGAEPRRCAVHSGQGGREGGAGGTAPADLRTFHPQPKLPDGHGPGAAARRRRLGLSRQRRRLACADRRELRTSLRRGTDGRSVRRPARLGRPGAL